ncbi:hypothetical protein Taro_002124 [Colocasia esculenta]|uniref:Uncharacterized protein n=1 Tax=Colocasia esculenta TaxID=4460 RepID=A0A843TI65_COLES|nr:hypothetical protein [Colocasia esculenta]
MRPSHLGEIVYHVKRRTSPQWMIGNDDDPSFTGGATPPRRAMPHSSQQQQVATTTRGLSPPKSLKDTSSGTHRPVMMTRETPHRDTSSSNHDKVHLAETLHPIMMTRGTHRRDTSLCHDDKRDTS